MNMHYYKRNLGDYAKKAGRLTMLQHGAYTLLIDSCYDREIFPTLEQALEWTWASTEAEIEAVKFVLSRFFKLDDDGKYMQERILAELLDYHAKADVNKRIALERETKRREKSTNRAQPVNEAPPNQEPLTTNHKPRTINQEPETKNQDIDKPAKSGLPTAPYRQIIDLYHEILPELPRVIVETEDRKRLVKSFWCWVLTSNKASGARRAETAAEAIEYCKIYFELVRGNDFVMGRTERSKDHRNWKASIDYLLSDKGKKQIIENA